MILTTARLRLEPLAADDIDAFVAYRRDPEIARYQSWSVDYDRASAESLVGAQPSGDVPAPGEWMQLAIRAVSSDVGLPRLIGDVAIGADADQPHTFELGVTVAPAAQGFGYATEAVVAARDALFERGAHRIVMQGDARNTAVIQLMRRAGFRHEGTLLEADWFKGEWTSLERYALLHREWLAATSD